MRAMKDSGIEWIGKIPESWDVGQIGQLYDERKVKVSDRDYPPLSVTMKGIVPQLSTAAKTDAHDDRKLVKKGDFAINSRSDRRGSCGISSYDGSVSLINTILCPQTEMNPQYYDWLFHSTMFSDEFYKWGHGIVDDLWTTNWSDMKKIAVPLPTLEEQSRIAAYLDRQCGLIDSVIEKTKASVEEYKKLRQAVITQAVTKGVKGDRPMKDSGIEWIGEIPKEWEVTTVLKKITFEGGSQPPLTKFIHEEREGYIRLIQNRDYKTDAYITYVPIDSVTKFCDEDDVMVGRYGPPVFVIHRGLKGAYNVALMKAVPNGINRQWMYYFLQESTMLEYIISFSKRAAGQDGVDTQILKKYPMCVPGADEQQEIAEYLDKKCAEIDSLITKKEQFLTELESYKKSMIYEYVTGKKEVPQS